MGYIIENGSTKSKYSIGYKFKLIGLIFEVKHYYNNKVNAEKKYEENQVNGIFSELIYVKDGFYIAEQTQ